MDSTSQFTLGNVSYSLIFGSRIAKKELHEQVYLKTPAAATRSHIEDYPRLGETFCVHHIYMVGGSRHYLKGRPAGGCGLKVPTHIGERILFINFWQSTPLIKKLHFRGERFC